MTLTDLLVPTFRQMLATLSRWLDKAEGQPPAAGADALLAARLAPDMFPLATQVRFACVQAWEAVHRLQRRDFPAEVAAMLDEGRAGGERPGTLADARTRIAGTLALLDRLAPGALDADPATPIAHALPNGMIFDLTPEQYARDWALPQFYFHVMTAYAILRAEGVPLGKADYVAHMFPYLRAGTVPAALGWQDNWRAAAGAKVCFAPLLRSFICSSGVPESGHLLRASECRRQGRRPSF